MSTTIFHIVGFRAVGEWFDSFGNLLAILAGVASEQQTATVLDFISHHHLDSRPIRSLYPVVVPGEPDWRDYYGMLNLPHHYHNGGIWPFIGGFLIAALVKAGRMGEAEAALDRLGELNRAGHFNEWYHGETGEPMGVQHQAWSAGMCLFAAECVHRVSVPLGHRSSRGGGPAAVCEAAQTDLYRWTPCLHLPDTNDRHLLAVAIGGRAD